MIYPPSYSGAELETYMRAIIAETEESDFDNDNEMMYDTETPVARDTERCE